MPRQPKQSELSPAPDDPQPTLRWKIYYDDRFDRDMPATVEVEGVGLVPALAELWARFLFETVQTASSWRDGKVEEIPDRGFSEFTLTGDQLRVALHGSLAGAFRQSPATLNVLSGPSLAELAVMRLNDAEHVAPLLQESLHRAL